MMTIENLNSLAKDIAKLNNLDPETADIYAGRVGDCFSRDKNGEVEIKGIDGNPVKIKVPTD